jgi:phosphoribosyl 1,2-cyclic phosphodiesterase
MKPEARQPARDGRLSVRFWGTRGSLPRPGPEFLRYGGNTTCVEVRLGSRLFLIDGGSGLQAAGASLGEHRPAVIDILFSHLHHDHTIGLPFFPPALDKSCAIRTFCGNLDGNSAEAALDRMFAPPLFPVTLGQLPCQWRHTGFRAGETLRFEDGIAVRTCALLHPGGATAYRFDHAGASVCYVSDIEHQPGAPDAALVALCTGADLIIYDSMFTDDEFQACRGWGHSTLGAGVLLCRTAGARALAATHHHIRHTDAMLDQLDAELKAIMPGSFLAREGQSLRVGVQTAQAHAPALTPESVL